MKKWFKNNWNKLKSKISSKVSPKFYKILSVLISFPVATLMLHNVLSTKIVEIAEDLGIELDPEEMVHLLHVAEEMLHLFLEETKTKTKFDTLYESMVVEKKILSVKIANQFADKSGKSEQEVEKLWNKAIKIVKDKYEKKENDRDFYAIAIGVLKKMLNLEENKFSNMYENMMNESSYKDMHELIIDIGDMLTDQRLHDAISNHEFSDSVEKKLVNHLNGIESIIKGVF